MTNQLVGLDICVRQQDTFYPHQDLEQVNFHEKLGALKVGRSARDKRVTTNLQLVSIKLPENSVFKSAVAATLPCYAKRR